eukprot:COSAG06_NODE_561_length_14287_cov_13.422047_3_plen_91_part_00
MATFESSFHPVFWLHHNNIDRFYQKYIEMHPDSTEEFKAKQVQHSTVYSIQYRYSIATYTVYSRKPYRDLHIQIGSSFVCCFTCYVTFGI